MKMAWEWLKKWCWAIIIGIIGLLALGRKPKWVRRKEREVKAQDEEIAKSKNDTEDVLDIYEEVKADHDEAIRQAAEQEDRPPITDADDAANFIDDILGRR